MFGLTHASRRRKRQNRSDAGKQRKLRRRESGRRRRHDYAQQRRQKKIDGGNRRRRQQLTRGEGRRRLHVSWPKRKSSGGGRENRRRQRPRPRLKQRLRLRFSGGGTRRLWRVPKLHASSKKRSWLAEDGDKRRRSGGRLRPRRVREQRRSAEPAENLRRLMRPSGPGLASRSVRQHVRRSCVRSGSG
jgi:hypothetical protein